MEILFAVISLASSVLAIILFFKVWAMCNHVQQINEKISPAVSNAALLMLAGDKEKAGDAVKIEYVKKLKMAYLTDSSIQAVIDKYSPILAELEVELPEHLKSESAFNKYYGKCRSLGIESMHISRIWKN